MTRIALFSHHLVTMRQQAALEEAFGPHVSVTQYMCRFDTATEMAQRFKEDGADEMWVVAPMFFIQHIIKEGVRPLWAEMAICTLSHPEREVTQRGRHYRFVKFWRLTGLSFVKEELPQFNQDQPSLGD